MIRFQHWTKTLASAVVAVAATSGQAFGKDIVDTAVEAGSFKTLAAALTAADLVGALKGDGPFTVFAPTDEAFSKLPKGTVETLLKPENKQQLIDVLTYHVVKGNVPAVKVVSLSGATTLNGQQVDIKVEDGNVTVDKANVVKTDILCDNGVIHVIDSVILPPEKHSAVAPRKMIESAIAQGAALYNSGHAGECAKVYMSTAKNILKMDNNGMCSATTQVLETALVSTQHTSCVDTQAWTMRRALDVAYNDVR